MLRRLVIVLHLVEAVLIWVAVLSAAAMMLLTSLDAFSRYALNSPINGAYEITEKYLMVAAIFLGLSFAYRGGAFIRVTFLVDRLPRDLKLASAYFAHLISLIFCVLFVFATTQQAIRAAQDATTLTTLPLSLAPAYWLAPLGFLAMTLLMIADLRRVRSGKSLLLAQEAPTS